MPKCAASSPVRRFNLSDLMQGLEASMGPIRAMQAKQAKQAMDAKQKFEVKFPPKMISKPRSVPAPLMRPMLASLRSAPLYLGTRKRPKSRAAGLASKSRKVMHRNKTKRQSPPKTSYKKTRTNAYSPMKTSPDPSPMKTSPDPNWF